MKSLILLAATTMLFFSLSACTTKAPAPTVPVVAQGAAAATPAPVVSTATLPPENSITLRLAEVHAEGYPTTLADREFARLVSERTNGRIKIEVFSGGQLGDEKDCIEQLQSGAIDFTRVSASPIAEFSKDINALLLPYLYRDAEHMWKVLDGAIGQGLLKGLSSAKIAGLAWYDSGARNFYTIKEVRKIEDLKGLKIRVQDNEMMMAMVTAIGATPVVLPTSATYAALQTGVIDGAENNCPSYDSFGHSEVAKYFILDGHTRVPDILCGSEVLLATFSPEDQEVIRDCAKQTQAFQMKIWSDRERKSKITVEGKGTTTVVLPAEELAKFSDAMTSLYDDFGKDYKDLIQKIKDTK